MLTADQIRSVAPTSSAKIVQGVVQSMASHGREFGLDRPHREVHFMAQIAHESAHFRTTTEYASGAAYEGRKDLGNTRKGDGKRFRGRGLIQLTGRANHRTFTDWMVKRAPGSPDFEAEPELVADFPWAFLASVYYWQSRNLNRYADQNNIEMISRRINGGYNGYQDRLNYYTKFGLVRLGYKPDQIRQFQQDADIIADGLSGPQTRQAIYAHLLSLEAHPQPRPKPPEAVPAPPPPSPPGNIKRSFWAILAALFGRLFHRS
jgi:putative chitinase